MPRILSLALSLGLLLVSWPAAAVERLVEIRSVPPAVAPVSPLHPVDIDLAARTDLPQLVQPVVPVLPSAPETIVAGTPEISPAGQADLKPGAPERVDPAAPVAALAQPLPPSDDPTAGWAESSRRFDNAGKPLKTAGVFAGVAAAGTAVALAAPYLRAWAPFLDTASYGVGNALSIAFPLPEAYAAFRKGQAKDFPLVRALIGAAGTMALGLVNATVLGKPLWGVMHAFIALGMLAPYFIGKARGERGEMNKTKAVLATAALAVAMLGASAGLYFGAAALVPAYLAAHLSAAAVAQLLLWIQLAKGALFVAVFAPDIADMIKGRPTKGFSKTFTSIYLASVAAFTFWGFTQAAFSPAGPIREQYLVHGARNLFETIASALSLIAIIRAGRKQAKAAK